ncbi:MAG: right-handed parallel beta-helix repeat-containing protein [Patescibacteria group bacterium]|nr:right-handed parallel beta-helix repeat-containing protein [Patescibacteria group bacterium]
MTACAAGIAAMMTAVPAVSAASQGTHVGGTLQSDASWTKDHSPYLLDSDVYVTAGHVLTIGPGVKVASAVVSPNYSIDIDPGASLVIAGTADGRVDIGGGLGRIYSYGGDIKISYADLHTQLTDLYLSSSTVSIDHSTIRGSTGSGISVQRSKVSVTDSRIEGNAYAGISVLAGPPGGQAFLIHNSAIVGNGTYSLANSDSGAVHAEGDWWGSPDGPVHDGPNKISGPISYQPWLAADPTVDPVPDPAPLARCCSSVLFIPGLEGTRLYEDRPSGIGRKLLGQSTTTDRLWEPNGNSDVSALYMKSDGTSADQSVYSGSPIDRAYGLIDVYGGFMRFLDGLVGNGTVDEWRAFGYDWRKPIAEVVAGPERKATTTQSLVGIVEDMASSSKTGKVSIVAHSNGGLVAKYLVKTLADMGKASLIDSVVSVAVPFLGTPMAIPALLYGDGQSIAWGLIATQANAQGLAENMPSAYSLLPSTGYFDRVDLPTVVMASTSADTAAVQDAFLASTGKANSLLLNAANALHNLLDPFAWPVSIARWVVAGFGKDTVVGVNYPSSGKHVNITNPNGDGTVKAQSIAEADGYSQIVPVDLSVQSVLDNKDISHTDILESSNMQALIGDVLSNASPTSTADGACSHNPALCNTKVIDEISKLPGVTVGDMDWNAMDAAYEASRKELYVTVHSPVALNVYDNRGRHTGELPAPTVDLDTGEPIEPGLLKRFEAGIPGSYFSTNEGDDYITLPDDGQTYTVSVQGTGVGVFGLEIGRERATSTVETIVWSDVPITPSSSATTTVESNGDPDVNGTALASSSAPLRLDIDGDGVTDAVSGIGAFAGGSDRFIGSLKKACDPAKHELPPKSEGGEHGWEQCKGLIEKSEHSHSASARPSAKAPIDSHVIINP